MGGHRCPPTARGGGGGLHFIAACPKPWFCWDTNPLHISGQGESFDLGGGVGLSGPSDTLRPSEPWFWACHCGWMGGESLQNKASQRGSREVWVRWRPEGPPNERCGREKLLGQMRRVKNRFQKNSKIHLGAFFEPKCPRCQEPHVPEMQSARGSGVCWSHHCFGAVPMELEREHRHPSTGGRGCLLLQRCLIWPAKGNNAPEDSGSVQPNRGPSNMVTSGKWRLW